MSLITPASVSKLKDEKLKRLNLPPHEYLILFGNKIDVTPIYAELAKRNFYTFVKMFWNTFVPVEMEDAWHIRFLCDKLQELVLRVMHKKPSRDLLINLPPGTSKSILISQALPAWILAHSPQMKIISASNNYTSAENNSTKCRTIMQSAKYRAFFPTTKLNPVQESKGHFETTVGGGRITTSLGSSIIGKHADILLIDDFDDYRTVHSPTERQKVQNWLKGDLSTRKTNKLVSSTVYVQQRLGFADSSSFLLEVDPDIEHICLPADISDPKIAALVKPAEAKKIYVDGLMDPNRLSRDHLNVILRDMKGSTLRFNTEMNQFPSDDSSSPIKRTMFPIIPVLSFFEMLKKHPNAVPMFYMDSAFTNPKSSKRADRNDPSVILAVFYLDNNLYVFNMFRDFLEGPELEDKTKEFLKLCNYHPTKSVLMLEKKASGHSLMPYLKKAGINIVPSPNPADEKSNRLLAASGTLKAGHVILVEAAWNTPFLDEVCMPAEQKLHDDIGDVLSMAVEDLVIVDQPVKVTSKQFSFN